VIWHPAGNTSALALPPEIVLYDDPRNRIIGNADLGFRTLTTGVPEINGDVVALGDINDWHYRRIARGVPEGPIDLTPERALMLEAGLDQLGAVDFAKGCYIGQEVTARTHYRGLVKRRLVPIMINAAPPAPDSDITYAGAVIATTKTSSCNTSSCITSTGASIALCLIKLSDIHAILADPVGLFVEGASASLAIPDWMTPLPDPARTDKANR
jgi:folate-binding protein YgfZ